MSVLSLFKRYFSLSTWLKKLLLLYTPTDPLLPAAVTRSQQQSGLHLQVDHLIKEDKRQRRASEE